GDTGQWVKTLEGARKLGATTVCPGHGPLGTAAVLEDQQSFFVALRQQVTSRSGKSPEQMKAAVDEIKTALLKQDRIARYVGDSLTSQVEKVYVELGGKPFQSKQSFLQEQERHAHAHGVDAVAKRELETKKAR